MDGTSDRSLPTGWVGSKRGKMDAGIKGRAKSGVPIVGLV